MKYKIIKVALIIIIVASVLVGTVACSTRVDEERNQVKPDVRTALDNYEALETKKSDLNGKIIVKLFGNPTGPDKLPNVYTVGQEAILSRILNNGTTYMEGRLGSCNVSDNVTALVGGLGGLIEAKDNDKASMLAYLNGQTYYTMNMGHRAGIYNIKTAYHDGTANPKPFWAATDDDSINAFISNNNINYQVTIADYLMFSTFMDLSKAGKWIINDNASKFFSTDARLYYYNIEASNDKIYEMIFDTITKYVAMLSKVEHEQFLILYEKVLPYLKKWIAIGKATVDVAVNEDAYPTHMLTKTTVYLDMTLEDINKVVDILIENKEEAIKIKRLVLAANGIMIRNRKGETGGISVDFDIILDEKFSYDEESCCIDNVDQDLFLETAAENSEREVYYVAKESALPSTEEVEGNNEIKVSGGDDDANEP